MSAAEIILAITAAENAFKFGETIGNKIGTGIKSLVGHPGHVKKYGLPLVKKFGSKKAALEHLKNAQKYV